MKSFKQFIKEDTDISSKYIKRAIIAFQTKTQDNEFSNVKLNKDLSQGDKIRFLLDMSMAGKKFVVDIELLDSTKNKWDVSVEKPDGIYVEMRTGDSLTDVVRETEWAIAETMDLNY